MSLQPRDSAFDVLVIGGGIAGAGVARDASLRGLTCLLVDKGDFASGTSSKTSHLIHGGISYMERGEFQLVLENMHERALLTRMAPHLVRPLTILMPVYAGDSRKLWKIRLALGLYDWLSQGKGSGRRDILRPSATLRSFPFLNPEGLAGAAVFRDHQLALPERLVLENILSAREHGAHCLNYHEVLRIGEARDFLEVELRDALDGRTRTVTARAVVNAAGVWADRVSECYQPGLAPKVLPMKGTHLAVRCDVHRPLCASSRKDGRVFFAMPLEDEVLLGLAQSEHAGDIDQVAPTKEETDVLIEELQRLLPQWRPGPHDLYWASSALHPLAVQKVSRGRLVPARRHVLHQEGPGRRFFTIVGGTFSTFRKMAEDAVDGVCRLLGHPIPSSTDRVPFFGGGFRDNVVYRETLCEWGKGIPDFPRETLDHLIALYGRRCCEVIQVSLERGEWREPVAPGYRDTKAQVIYAVRHEDAHHVSDVVLRRLRMGLSADRGLSGAPAVAALMGSELAWDDATREAELDSFRRIVSLGRPFAAGALPASPSP